MTSSPSKGSGPLYFDIQARSNNFFAGSYPENVDDYQIIHFLGGAADIGGEVLEHLSCLEQLRQHLADPSKLERFAYRWKRPGTEEALYPNNRMNLLHLLAETMDYIPLGSDPQTAFNASNVRTKFFNQFIQTVLRSGVHLLEKDQDGKSFLAKILTHSTDSVAQIKEFKGIFESCPEAFIDLTEDGKSLLEFGLFRYYLPEYIDILVALLPSTALSQNLEAMRNKKSIGNKEYVMLALQARIEKELIETQVEEVNSPNKSSFKL